MNTQLNKSTNQKSPKLLSQRTIKRYYKSLGTSVINRPLSPLSLAVAAVSTVLGQAEDKFISVRQIAENLQSPFLNHPHKAKILLLSIAVVRFHIKAAAVKLLASGPFFNKLQVKHGTSFLHGKILHTLSCLIYVDFIIE